MRTPRRWGHQSARDFGLDVYAAGVLLIGLWPQPLTDLMEPSIAQLASQLVMSKL